MQSANVDVNMAHAPIIVRRSPSPALYVDSGLANISAHLILGCDAGLAGMV
jgi:hypothetical protein